MKHAKHAKHAIVWSTPTFWGTSSTPFHGARQARKHLKHAKYASTPNTWVGQARKASKTRHLADSP